MSTNPEAVRAFRNLAEQLKQTYIEKISYYDGLGRAKNKQTQRKQGLQSINESALSYFNAYEQFVADSELIGAHNAGGWVVNLAEDCHSVLESIEKHYGFMKRECEALNEDPQKYRPGATAYASMQRMVVQYLKPNLRDDLKNKFTDAGLPVYGFDNPDLPHRTNGDLSPQIILAVSLGVFFLLTLLVIAVYIPNPTIYQMFIFRVILTIAAAAFGAIIPGFLSIQGKIPGFVIRAGGALALATLVYLVNPPSLVVEKQPEKQGDSHEIHDPTQKPATPSRPQRTGDAD